MAKDTWMTCSPKTGSPSFSVQYGWIAASLVRYNAGHVLIEVALLDTVGPKYPAPNSRTSPLTLRPSRSPSLAPPRRHPVRSEARKQPGSTVIARTVTDLSWSG